MVVMVVGRRLAAMAAVTLHAGENVMQHGSAHCDEGQAGADDGWDGVGTDEAEHEPGEEGDDGGEEENHGEWPWRGFALGAEFHGSGLGGLLRLPWTIGAPLSRTFVGICRVYDLRQPIARPPPAEALSTRGRRRRGVAPCAAGAGSAGPAPLAHSAIKDTRYSVTHRAGDEDVVEGRAHCSMVWVQAA